ncbi:MAG: hypothetical protein JW927_13925 [Deltaproteobacteria bacterium]|nr:hypothetical protein [Deltaproteobacteria bacterium]
MKKFLLVTFLFGMAVVALSATVFGSPYATDLISYSSTLTGSSLYNDPNAVIGAPATDFKNTWGSAATAHVKLVEPAYNVGLDGSKLITTLNNGQYIVAGFDHQVMNDPNNPFGLDFLVFGNAFYTGSGSVSDASNMSTYMLSGGSSFNGAGFFENVVVSVSQGPAYEGQDQSQWTWYAYSNGPYGDNAYPTHAYEWDQAQYDATGNGWTTNLMDFTKPVDPDVFGALLGQTGVSAADAIEAYQGSGGGTGFDLDDLYLLYGVELDWIQYIKVEGISGYSGGEIDAFSDVAPVPIPGAIWLLGTGVMCLIGIRRRNNL